LSRFISIDISIELFGAKSQRRNQTENEGEGETSNSCRFFSDCLTRKTDQLVDPLPLQINRFFRLSIIRFGVEGRINFCPPHPLLFFDFSREVFDAFRSTKHFAKKNFCSVLSTLKKVFFETASESNNGRAYCICLGCLGCLGWLG
jgi:hypothetical protein